MRIRTRFNIGDKVVVFANKKIKEVCPFCEGKGHRIIDTHKFYCQNCENGEVFTETNYKEEVIVEIIGINYSTMDIKEANIKAEMDKQYFSRVTETEAIRIDYVVKNEGSNYSINETYKEGKIIRKIPVEKEVEYVNPDNIPID